MLIRQCFWFKSVSEDGTTALSLIQPGIEPAIPGLQGIG